MNTASLNPIILSLVTFIPDETVFKNYKFHPEFLENQIWNYCFLNAGLRIVFNGKSFVSKNGLLDLLQRKTSMKVLQVTDRTKVQPNCVYVIPPNADLSILHGKLQVLEPAALERGVSASAAAARFPNSPSSSRAPTPKCVWRPSNS